MGCALTFSVFPSARRQRSNARPGASPSSIRHPTYVPRGETEATSPRSIFSTGRARNAPATRFDAWTAILWASSSVSPFLSASGPA